LRELNHVGNNPTWINSYRI